MADFVVWGIEEGSGVRRDSMGDFRFVLLDMFAWLEGRQGWAYD